MRACYKAHFLEAVFPAVAGVFGAADCCPRDPKLPPLEAAPALLVLLPALGAFGPPPADFPLLLPLEDGLIPDMMNFCSLVGAKANDTQKHMHVLSFAPTDKYVHRGTKADRLRKLAAWGLFAAWQW